LVSQGDDGRITFLHDLCGFHLNSNCVEKDSYQLAKLDVSKIEEWLLSTYKEGSLPNLYAKNVISHAILSICIYNDDACITKGLDNYASKEYYTLRCVKGFNLPNDICNTGEVNNHDGL
jgi:hypothetical protein